MPIPCVNMSVREHLVKIDIGRGASASVRPKRCRVEAVGLNDCVVYQLLLLLRTRGSPFTNTLLVNSLSVCLRCAALPTG
jgi:hypothetical protein